jgi:3-oxoacyl-[acyl-carrier-protein] synthase II
VSERRVVITGLGLVTPVGVGAAECWSALTSGRSAVGRVNLVGEQGEARHLAAAVPEFNVRSYVSDRKLLRLMCRSDRFGLAAAQMAVAEAGADAYPPERRGVYTATSKEMGPIEDLFEALRASRDETGEMTSVLMGSRGFSLTPPLTLVSGLANGCLFALSVLHTIVGPNTNFLGSGEAGLLAIGTAYQAVQRGDIEWALAGGHDSGVDRWSYADFHRLGLISRWEGDPARAVKAFDRRRDGFAVGEGAGMVVLEDRAQAERRRAPVLAEVIGYAATCDATGMVRPDREGTALAEALREALRRAGAAPDEVDYVNAYGSATPAGDRTELKALKAVFGSGRRPLVSGVKGAIGHLLAASGAAELGATVLALRSSLVPPTLNLEEPEPGYCFDLVPREARPAPVRTAVTISRGIGGQNAAIVLRREEE